MSYADLVTTRHSVRSYKKTPVEPEKVQAILEAGRLAPSAVNNQPTRVAVCDTPEVLSRVAAATGRMERDGSVFLGSACTCRMRAYGRCMGAWL